MMSPKRQGACFGLTAALLFGISPPVAKLLLPESGPMLTAGLLYLGAGLGLLLFEMTGRPWLNSGMEEAQARAKIEQARCQHRAALRQQQLGDGRADAEQQRRRKPEECSLPFG